MSCLVPVAPRSLGPTALPASAAGSFGCPSTSYASFASVWASPLQIGERCQNGAPKGRPILLSGIYRNPRPRITGILVPLLPETLSRYYRNTTVPAENINTEKTRGDTLDDEHRLDGARPEQGEDEFSHGSDIVVGNYKPFGRAFQIPQAIYRRTCAGVIFPVIEISALHQLSCWPKSRRGAVSGFGPVSADALLLRGPHFSSMADQY